MTALAQGCAGLALVMGFALLRTRQISAASILLAVQSGAVAVSAIVLRQPAMAFPPLLLAVGVWLAPDYGMVESPIAAPLGGPKVGVAIAAILAVLCQSQGALALPLTLVLLSVLLAATRRHPFMHLIALVGLGNALALTACLVLPHDIIFLSLLASACVLLPLPLALGLITSGPRRPRRPAPSWIAWVDIGVAVAVLAGTLVLPLDPLGAMFAPLLGLDGIMRSCRRRQRRALSLQARALESLSNLFMVLAVVAPAGIGGWLAVLAALATALLPTVRRRWSTVVLAFLGAGVALFGLVLLPSAGQILGLFSLFAGCIMIATIVPDLAAVLVIIVLRLAGLAVWPPLAQALAIGLCLISVITCGMLRLSLRGRPVVAWPKRSAAAVLQLGQAAIAALSISLGYADGRFAAVVLLVLLILTRAAARLPGGSVAPLAIAGLAGVPPLGVFPGLVLVALTISSHHAWLLLPIGGALAAFILGSLPRNLPVVPQTLALPSISWLPFMLALFVGYFAPDRFVRWCHLLSAGHG